jgi:hypothetical protein
MESITFRRAAATAAVIGSFVALTHFERQDDARERATESCVSELVDREVNLVQDVNGGLSHPASVIQEQLACEQNDNDSALASQH